VAAHFLQLKSGLSGVLHGPYILFSLTGLVGLLRSASPALLAVAVTTCVYATSHLIIFPNPERPDFSGHSLLQWDFSWYPR